MNTLSQIGAQLAEARKNLRLSQQEVARRAAVSLRTINLLESGNATDLGYSKLARILAAAGLELRLQPIAQQRPTLDDLLREDLASESPAETAAGLNEPPQNGSAND
jgi:transcriptional regulator with XRE-family HTH domain